MTSAYEQWDTHIDVHQDDTLDNTFVLTVYSGWTWDHVALADEAIRAQKANGAPTHVLIEIDGPIPMPDGIDDMSKHWLDTHMKHHGGLIVFVTDWAMIESLFKLVPVNKTGPLKMVRFAKTPDEAYRIIHEWERIQ